MRSMRARCYRPHGYYLGIWVRRVLVQVKVPVQIKPPVTVVGDISRDNLFWVRRSILYAEPLTRMPCKNYANIFENKMAE